MLQKREFKMIKILELFKGMQIDGFPIMEIKRINWQDYLIYSNQPLKYLQNAKMSSLYLKLSYKMMKMIILKKSFRVLYTIMENISYSGIKKAFLKYKI